MNAERKAIERARGRLEKAPAELAESCAKARKAGVPMKEIASLAGMSRDGVYKLLERHGL